MSWFRKTVSETLTCRKMSNLFNISHLLLIVLHDLEVCYVNVSWPHFVPRWRVFILNDLFHKGGLKSPWCSWMRTSVGGWTRPVWKLLISLTKNKKKNKNQNVKLSSVMKRVNACWRHLFCREIAWARGSSAETRSAATFARVRTQTAGRWQQRQTDSPSARWTPRWTTAPPLHHRHVGQVRRTETPDNRLTTFGLTAY